MVGENVHLYRRDYVIAIICLLIIAATTAFSAWIIGPVVKDVFYGNNLRQAFVLASLILGIFLLRGVVTYIQAVILNKIGNSMVARYQRRLFDHLLQLNVGFFGQTHSVELISRLSQNIVLIRDLLNTLLLTYVRDIITLVGLISVMIYRDPIMTAATFTIGPAAFYMVGKYARKVKKIAREEVQINAQVATAMQEAAHGIAVVKSFTMEDQLKVRQHELTRSAETRSNKIARITARTNPLMETLAGLAVAGVIAYGGWRVIMHGYEPSDLTSFITALLLCYDPAKRLAKMRVTLERSMVSARMIYELLDTEPQHTDREGAVPLNLSDGEIRLDGISFHYREDGVEDEHLVPVLNDISFIAEAGKTTALVGPSGGGKSTIIALVQRFYDVETGAITVDGQDIRDVTVESLRSKIAYVSQHPVLFQGTIYENLAYARPEATREDIVDAAMAAQAHEFIMALPDGYDTELGENGTNLSGGQRQRLSIARALVRNAPILLLDEATSALDNESEARVQEALEELMQGRTTIVIAHRLSTITSADNIIVIDRGVVVDQGSHADLLGREGVYARLQPGFVSGKGGNKDDGE